MIHTLRLSKETGHYLSPGGRPLVWIRSVTDKHELKETHPLQWSRKFFFTVKKSWRGEELLNVHSDLSLVH